MEGRSGILVPRKTLLPFEKECSELIFRLAGGKDTDLREYDAVGIAHEVHSDTYRIHPAFAEARNALIKNGNAPELVRKNADLIFEWCKGIESNTKDEEGNKNLFSDHNNGNKKKALLLAMNVLRSMGEKGEYELPNGWHALKLAIRQQQGEVMPNRQLELYSTKSNDVIRT